jgi:hypothetical protein
VRCREGESVSQSVSLRESGFVSRCGSKVPKKPFEESERVRVCLKGLDVSVSERQSERGRNRCRE